MAEAQAQTTSAPAAEAAPGLAETGIASMLGEIANEAPEHDAGEGEIAETNTANDSAETETEEGKPAAQTVGDDVLFSDEALSTKEGVLAAKTRVRELRKKQHDAYVGLKKYDARVAKRHEKLQASTAAFVAEKRNHDLLLGNVRSNLQGLHSGDPDAMITALGNITGRDGVEALNMLNSRLVHKGKVPLDPQIQEMLDRQEQQITEMRQQLEDRDARQRKASQVSQLDAHRQNIGKMVAASAATPHLVRVFNDDPEFVTHLIEQAIYKSNGSIPAHELFRQMEQELTSHLGAAPRGEGGNGAAKTTPTTQQRAQRSPGQSIGPRAAATSTHREPTEAESLQQLANDPNFLKSLGLNL